MKTLQLSMIQISIAEEKNAVGLVQMGAAVDDDDDHRLRYKMVPSSQICNKRQ